MATYRLLAGKHTQKEPVKDEKGKPKLDENGAPLMERKTYQRGDVFESQTDLVAVFNHPNAVKFELVKDPKARYSEGSTGGNDPVEDAHEQRDYHNTVTAPGGQASQGFQSSAKGGTEGGIGGISNPAPPTLAQVAEQKAKEAKESAGKPASSGGHGQRK